VDIGFQEEPDEGNPSHESGELLVTGRTGKGFMGKSWPYWIEKEWPKRLRCRATRAGSTSSVKARAVLRCSQKAGPREKVDILLDHSQTKGGGW